MHAPDAERVEPEKKRTGKVERRERNIFSEGKSRHARRAAAVEGPEVAESDDPTAARIERPAATDEWSPPAAPAAGARAAGQRGHEQDGANAGQWLLGRVASWAEPPTVQPVLSDDAATHERQVGQLEQKIDRHGRRWTRHEKGKRQVIGTDRHGPNA